MNKDQVVKLINSVIVKHSNVSKEIGKITKNDIEPITFIDAINNRNSIIGYSEKKSITNYVLSLTPNRIKDEGLFYHYLKLDYAKQIIRKNEIQLSSLSHYLDTDPFEYGEFYRNFITFHPSNIIEREKDKIFVFCMTEDCRNNYMWKHYADNEKGIVLGFRFAKKGDASYHFRNVVYEDGESLDFLKEINFYLQKEDLVLSPEGISILSLFYKRKRFESEKEIRLCVDFTGERTLWEENTELIQVIKKENNRRYLPLSFDNNLCKIDLCEIICGKNVTREQFEELKNLAHNNIKIWKR